MADPQVITALARKRGQLAGEIEAAQTRLQDLIAALEWIDNAILVFDPDYRVVGIRPIAYRSYDKGRAPRGELPRMILDMLREAAVPMTAPDITRAIMAAKGKDPADVRAYRHWSTKVNAVLRRHRQRGAVRSGDGPGVDLVWSVSG